MKPLIAIRTDNEKRDVLAVFNRCKSKSEILRYYNKSDNSYNWKKLDELAKEIGFDFSIYNTQQLHIRCKCCKNEFVPSYKSQIFCSRSCSATYNNRIRIRNSKENNVHNTVACTEKHGKGHSIHK